MSANEPEDEPEASPSPPPEEGEGGDADGRALTRTPQELFDALRPVIAPGLEAEAFRRVTEFRMEARSGPLPSARELAEYDDTLPGLANRIVTMAEAEQGHRHSVQTLVMGTESKLKLRGQPYAIGALVLLSTLVVAFLWFKAPKEAAAVAVAVIVLVVAMFLGPEITKVVARTQGRSESEETTPRETLPAPASPAEPPA